MAKKNVGKTKVYENMESTSTSNPVTCPEDSTSKTCHWISGEIGGTWTSTTNANINLDEIREKRDNLIATLKPLLLSKSMLKKGGRAVRSQYEKEKGYEAVIQEINELNKVLGDGKVGLGSLRAE